jgi:hypothetical protein
MTVRNNWGEQKSSVPKAAVAFPILVAEWPRNEREVLRIMLSKFRGRISIDVRVWFGTERGELRPSRRGVSLRLTEISDIRAGMRKAEEIAVEAALGPSAKKTKIMVDRAADPARPNAPQITRMKKVWGMPRILLK